MSDNFGGGYNINERPIEYYKTNKSKNFKTNSVENLEFNKMFIKNQVTNLNKSKQNSLTSKMNNLTDQDGTNIAELKEVSKQFADQIYGIMWNQIYESIDIDHQGGFGEKMFQKSLIPELVKSSNKGKPDQIEQAILKDLMRQKGYIEKNDVKPQK